jgi:hypothetical protein
VTRLNRERGITFIADGRILSDGPLSELRSRVTRERWLTVDLVQPHDSIQDPDATVIRHDGHRVCLAFDPQHVSPAELIRRVTSGHAIRDLFVENPPIETIIARLYEHSVARYPLAIYHPWLRRFFTFVILLACINYFPGVAILGRVDPLGTSVLIQWLAPWQGRSSC